MTRLLLVDWLPRGGIPQTTAAWRDVARGAGMEVRVLGRAGSELAPDVGIERRLAGKLGAAEAHLRLVRAVVREIRRTRPDVVYVQHTWAPLVERRVLRAARSVGARSVIAIHNARPHERGAGLHAGLAGLLDLADEVVVHSDHVARELGRADAHRIGLPELTAVTRATPVPVPGLETVAPHRVVTFGVLRRGYKGLSELADVAAELGSAWEVVAAGVGAADAGPAVRTHDGYLSPAQLRWLVGTADAVLLPYVAASQSGAVPLAQVLGVPPVASAVGGIPEQIDHGHTGILVGAGTTSAWWARAIQQAAQLDGSAIRTRAKEDCREAAVRWIGLVEGSATTDAGRPRAPRSGTG